MDLQKFLAAAVAALLAAPTSCKVLRTRAVKADHNYTVDKMPQCQKCDQADPCFEAEVQRDVIVQNAEREQLLYTIFRQITSDCATGRYSLTCVQSLEYEEHPQEFLRSCQAQRGHEHMNSFATCEYAARKEAHLKKAAQGWGSLKWIILQAVDNCEQVPYECVALITHCLDAQSIRFCFNQCLRTGHMDGRVQ